MLDDIGKLLELASHWPDLTSVLLGSIAGYIVALALEAFFLPTTSDPETKRRQKGITFVLCWLVSTVASAELWWAIDMADKAAVRWIVCAVCTVGSFFIYPALARFLTAKFPAIGTAWSSGP